MPLELIVLFVIIYSLLIMKNQTTNRLNMLVFKLITRDGHEYRLYANGECIGFPEGTCIANFAAPLVYELGALRAKLREKEFNGSLVSEEKS